jgi:hypothetical protein
MFLKTPDFPVWQLTPNGTWITTRSHLKAWAERQVHDQKYFEIDCQGISE